MDNAEEIEKNVDEECIENADDGEIEQTEETDETDEESKINWKKEVLDWIVSIAIAIIIALVIRTYVFTLVKVDGPSMNPTLTHGDTLYTNRFFYTPKNGDIIIFRPKNSPETPYVKRVIATEGQTVEIDEFSGDVIVDGKIIDEDYILEPLVSDGNMQYPCVVPENHVFVLGDNRNRSSDSRHYLLGGIDERLIIGKAVFRIFPGKNSLSEKRDFSTIGPL